MKSRTSTRRVRYIRDFKQGGSATQHRRRWVAHARTLPCSMCGATPEQATIRGHHVVPKSAMAAVAWMRYQTGWQIKPRVVWDLRNCLPLCDPCHKAHHDRKRRVPWHVVETHLPDVCVFASELPGVGDAWRNEYPAESQEARV